MKKVLLTLFTLILAVIGYAQTPSTASSSIAFSNVYCTQITVSWTNGDGSSRIVVVSEGSAVTASPTDNNFYIPNDTFGKGYAFTPNEYVVYNNLGNSVTIKELNPNTTYYIAVFEYNGGGAVINYLTSSFPTNNVTTEWLNADFTINDTYQCENVNSFTFTDNTTQSNSATLTYLWRFGDGTTSTAQSPSHVYVGDSFYTVELTVTSTRCLSIATKLDTVIPLPTVNFDLNPDSTNNTWIQCFVNQDGSSNRFAFRNLSDNGGLPNTVSTVTWTYGDGTSGNQFNGRKIYNAPGTYTVKLVYGTIMFPQRNNPGEFCIDSFTTTVTIQPPPIDSTEILFSDSALCLNGNLFYFDHLATAPSTNTWFFGDGASAMGKNVSHTYLASGKYAVKLEVVDVAGCYAEYQDTVEVIDQPNNFYTGLDSFYCEGDPSVVLFPNIIGGKFRGINIDSNSGTFTPDSTGFNYLSYVVNVNGCLDTFTRRTFVNSIPTFSLGNDTSFCDGTMVNLTTSNLTGVKSWSTGESSTAITTGNAGLIWAQVTENGCTFRDTVFLSRIFPPSIELGNDSTLCGGGVVPANVTADEGTYVWNDGFPGPIRNLDQTGNYSVTVSNKCGSASDDIDVTILPFACKIFIPNAFTPNGDQINDVFRPSGFVDLIDMRIFNRWGEMLYESVDPNNMQWDGTYNGFRVQPGHYYFVIRYLNPKDNGTIPTLEKGEVYLEY